MDISKAAILLCSSIKHRPNLLPSLFTDHSDSHIEDPFEQFSLQPLTSRRTWPLRSAFQVTRHPTFNSFRSRAKSPVISDPLSQSWPIKDSRRSLKVSHSPAASYCDCLHQYQAAHHNFTQKLTVCQAKSSQTTMKSPTLSTL